MKVTNQLFSPVNTVFNTFGAESDDGVFGLGYPSLSVLHQTPFISAAKNQGMLKNGVFGFKIAKSGSELYLGGTDSSLYTGAIEFHAVSGKTGYWQLGGGSLILGSTVHTARPLKTHMRCVLTFSCRKGRCQQHVYHH